jgi:hypothetical protein
MYRYVAAFFLISWASAFAEGRDAAYFCVQEAAGGLWYNTGTKKWEGAIFRPDNKFVLRMKYAATRTSDREAVSLFRITVTPSGSNYASPCVEFPSDTVELSSTGWMRCNANVTDYQFNINTNRFLAMYAVGYVNGRDDNSDTPSVSGGTCTKIE